MSFYLMSGASMALSTVPSPTSSFSDVLPPAFKSLVACGVFIAFVKELAHLCEEDSVGKVDSTVLMVECEILVLPLASICHGLTYIIWSAGVDCYLLALPTIITS